MNKSVYIYNVYKKERHVMQSFVMSDIVMSCHVVECLAMSCQDDHEETLRRPKQRPHETAKKPPGDQ